MVISRVLIRETPFRALITLLITYLLSPLPLQIGYTETNNLQIEVPGPRSCAGGCARRAEGGGVALREFRV